MSKLSSAKLVHIQDKLESEPFFKSLKRNIHFNRQKIAKSLYKYSVCVVALKIEIFGSSLRNGWHLRRRRMYKPAKHTTEIHSLLK